MDNTKILLRLLLMLSNLIFSVCFIFSMIVFIDLLNSTNPHSDIILVFLKYALCAFAIGNLIRIASRGIELYWRVNNFSEYERVVEKRLGYLPTAKPASNTASP